MLYQKKSGIVNARYLLSLTILNLNHMINKHIVFLFTLLISIDIQAATFSNTHIIDKGNYSIDTKTGIEWLDLTETAGLSYNDVSSKMGVGQEFEGWGYATTSQVATFFDGFGGSGDYSGWSASNNGLYNVVATLWGELYRGEYYTARKSTSSYFYTDSTELNYAIIGRIYDDDTERYGLKKDAMQLRNQYRLKNKRNELWGSALQRRVQVPEPSSMMLMGLGFLGMARMKRTMP